ncbi:MAG: cobyric acid synthase, partial [Methanoregulaceae archaeon]|nr:cobyric acid synthase [Methanoregulaceae archaeon]
LNSYVTRGGGEIGIAQAVQAFAAGVEPTVEMNPILLKPKGDQVSQVVLLGRPYKDVPIREYYQETDFLLQKALESANYLLDHYDHLVIEGAGGAAEINLYDRDIANIRLAESCDMPILLVADIERGGVFAQIYGTLMLLPPAIRKRVVGIVINKFRGDPSIFEKGKCQIEELAGVPVIGILPWTEVRLPSEDSLSIADKNGTASPVRIAVIRLPRISNFTDFEPLERQSCVEYVTPGSSLSGFDCVIIPGTKNTVGDLKILHESGASAEIHRARELGVPVIGICGGYQMLGTRIEDDGIESGSGTTEGLGLLDVVTYFRLYRKETVQVERDANPIPPILSRVGKVSGYEIHMGETRSGNVSEALRGDGAVSEDGLVIGTYMHGFFHNRGAVSALISYLYEKKGIVYDAPASDEQDPYDQIADHFSEHSDIALILRCFPEKSPQAGKMKSGSGVP